MRIPERGNTVSRNIPATAIALLPCYFSAAIDVMVTQGSDINIVECKTTFLEK